MDLALPGEYEINAKIRQFIFIKKKIIIEFCLNF